MSYWRSRRGIIYRWGVGDYKFSAAWYLVTNGFIKLTSKEIKEFDIRNRTRRELQRLTLHEAVVLLERRHWKFVNEPQRKDT